MRTKLTLLIAAIIGSIALALPAKADVVLNKTNFPDSLFRKYIAKVTRVAVNGTISDAKLASVDSIVCPNLGIADMTGVEYFTNLTKLNCYNDSVVTLDVSKNTKLTYLNCGINKLPSLKGIDKLLDLDSLAFFNNPITAIDVSKNTKLTYLNCLITKLPGINLEKNTQIKNFYGYFMRNIKVYSYNDSGKKVYYVPLTSKVGNYDVHSYASLIDAAGQAGEPQFDTTKVVAGSWSNATVGTYEGSPILILSDARPVFSFLENTSFTGNATYWCGEFTIWAEGNVKSPYVKFYAIWDSTKLEKPGVALNQTNFPDSTFRKYISELTGVAVNDIIPEDKIAAVNSINCFKLNIADLTGIQYFTNLTNLKLEYNSLASIDVSKNTKLTVLNTGCNPITSVVGLDKLTDLQKVSFYGNHLSTIDFSKNVKLTEIDIMFNWIKTIKGLTNLANLTRLDANGNEYTTLDLSGNPKLSIVENSYGYLAAIDLSNNPKIEIIYLNDNKRKIKVYAYSDSNNKVYYVPLTSKVGSADVHSLGTLIDSAGRTGDPKFDMSKIVANSWSGATASTYQGSPVLILDASKKKFSYSYNTAFNGNNLSVWQTGTAPNMEFSLTWDPNNLESDGVDGVSANGISIYSTAGHINVAGNPGSVNVFAIDGKAVYSGNETSIAVPAGIYIVRAGGTVKKVLVR
jgi:hypothetical protein